MVKTKGPQVMMSEIKGIVRRVNGGLLDVQVEGTGMTFSLQVTSGVVADTGQSLSVVTYLHWNQENGPSMFGFESYEQRELFLMALSCTGVGPKMALSLVSDLSLPQLVNAVLEHDAKVLSSVSGIGPKKAEQIIVQLYSKVKKLQAIPAQTGGSDLNKISQALESLNYSRPEIMNVMVHLKEDQAATGASFDGLMRQALAFLAKKV